MSRKRLADTIGGGGGSGGGGGRTIKPLKVVKTAKGVKVKGRPPQSAMSRLPAARRDVSLKGRTLPGMAKPRTKISTPGRSGIEAPRTKAAYNKTIGSGKIYSKKAEAKLANDKHYQSLSSKTHKLKTKASATTKAKAVLEKMAAEQKPTPPAKRWEPNWMQQSNGKWVLQDVPRQPSTKGKK
tara:strand:- start:112 stop:660 length:549 start_codon:yes stop_codon:yes gene_type:complete